MSSVVWNPFIYCWLNEAFRAKTKALLKCFIPRLCWRLLTGRSLTASSLPSLVGVGIGGDGRVLVMKNGGGGGCGGRRASGHHHRRIAAANGLIVNNVGAGVGGGLGGGSGGGNGGGVVDVNGITALERASVSWSSSTMSATGKQQAISELISMSALLEQDLLDSSTRYSIANRGNLDRGGGGGGGGAQTAASANVGGTSGPSGGGGGGGGNKHLTTLNYPIYTTKEQRLALTTTQSGRRKLHTSHCQLIMMLKMGKESGGGSGGGKADKGSVNIDEEEEDLDVERDVTKTTDVNLMSSSSPSPSSSIELEPTGGGKGIEEAEKTSTEEQQQQQEEKAL